MAAKPFADVSEEPGFVSKNRATNEILHTYENLSPSTVDEKICLAIRSFQKNPEHSITARTERIMELGRILDKNSESYGRLITTEMGKPVPQAVAEIKKCALLCRFYADNAESFLSPRQVNIQDAKNYVAYEPLGVILSIMPWNFPFWQALRFAVPAILAGNTVLMKHAENVPQCALAIENAFYSAGFEKGVLQNLFISHSQTAKIISHRNIRGITLTGSERAGSVVASLAGKHLKKTVLELGGSDPFIILPGADLEKAAQTGLRSRMMNTGQSCISAKRFIIHTNVYDEFLHLFSEKMKKLTITNPLVEDGDLGPMARHDLRDHLHSQVEKSIKNGAKKLFGCNKIEGQGAFYQPGILTNVPAGSPAHHEELFGPVASVFKADNDEEVLSLANDTPYGLGASVWCNDPEKARYVGNKLEAGSVFINSMVASHPALPFGGVKMSGYGRELSIEGIREFTNIKTYFEA